MREKPPFISLLMYFLGLPQNLTLGAFDFENQLEVCFFFSLSFLFFSFLILITFFFLGN